MTSVKVSLNTIDKVKTFVNVINTFDGDFDLVSDRYVIDAKSIMGIFSLDLKNDLTLVIHCDDKEVLDEVLGKLDEFIIK